MKVRLILVSVVSSVGILSLLFLANLFLTFVSPDLYLDRAENAVHNHLLVSRSGFPFIGPARPYRYGVNDCLILAMLTTKYPGSRIQAAVSPAMPDYRHAPTPAEFQPNGFDNARAESLETALRRGTPPTRECYALARNLSESPLRPTLYHRYIHGYLTLAATLLLILTYASATNYLHAIALLVPVIVIAVSWLRLRQYDATTRPMVIASMALAYLLFSGVTLYAWQIDLAPAEIILSLFMFVALLLPIGQLSIAKLTTMTALFGAVCVSFDFLRGLLPSALILLIALIAFEPDLDDASRLRRAAWAIASFLLAIIFTFAIKALVVMLLWSPSEVVDAADTLGRHMRSEGLVVSPSTASSLARFGINIEFIEQSRLTVFAYAVAKLVYFSDLLEFGSHVLGVLVTLVGPLVLFGLAVAALVRPRLNLSRSSALLLLIAIAVAYGWIFVFLQHVIDGATVMNRLLPWLTIVLFGYLGAAFGRRFLSWTNSTIRDRTSS